MRQQFPGPLKNAVFGKIAAGEFDGKIGLDAIVMDGNEPVLVIAPEVFSTAVRTGEAVNDFAVLAGVAPGKDVLLTVGATGLRSYERIPGQWIVTDVHGFSSPWAGAKVVRTADLDGGGGIDAVGLAANGTDVLISHGNGDGSFTAAPSFLSLGLAYDLQVLDWDGDGLDEIAVLSSAGVGVCEEDGTPIGSFNWSGGPILATVIGDLDAGGTPAAAERLAMVTRGAGQKEWLLILGQGFANGSPVTITEGPELLGPIGVVDVAAADFDGDGDDELFLSLTTSGNVRVLTNASPSTPTFSGSAYQDLPFGSASRDPSLNGAGVALADFDGDGDVDVLAPAQGDLVGPIVVYGEIDLIHGTAFAHTDYLAQVPSSSYYLDTGELEVDLGLPAAPLPGSQFTQTNLRVVVWHTSDLGQPTDAAPYWYADLPATGSLTVRVPMPAGFSPTALSQPNSTDLFSFVVRQTVPGAATAWGPARTFLFSPESNWPTIKSAPGTQSVVSVSPLLSNGDPPDSSPLGGIGIGPPPPPHQDDEQPQVP